MKDRLKQIRKKLIFKKENSVYKEETITVCNNESLVKKLEYNREIIANSYKNDTSTYKK